MGAEDKPISILLLIMLLKLYTAAKVIDNRANCPIVLRGDLVIKHPVIGYCTYFVLPTLSKSLLK